MDKNLIKFIQQDDVFKEKKSVTILISGGIDSACLLEYAYEMGYDVHLIYTNIKNNSVKSIREEKAIRRIIGYFSDKYHNWQTFYTNEIFLNAQENNYPILFKQMPIHIISGLCSSTKTDEVWIGYVMGDQGLSYIDVLEKIWKSYEMLWDISVSGKPIPELKFPLKRLSKRCIIEGMDQDLLQYVTFCESDDENLNQNNERCGVCDSCRRYDYEFPNKVMVTDKFHHFHSVKKNDIKEEGEISMSEEEHYEEITRQRKSRQKKRSMYPTKTKLKSNDLYKKSKIKK